MRRIAGVICGCALLLTGVVDPAEGQEKSREQREVTTVITGSVSSSGTLAPVEGAAVKLLVGGAVWGSARTDERGEYKIEGKFSPRAPGSSQRLQVVSQGFLPESSQFQLDCPMVTSVGDAPAYCRKSLDFFLQPSARLFQGSEKACSVSGKVVDDLGRPLAGAQMELQSAQRWALTDTLGMFRVEQVQAGLDLAVVQMIGFFQEQELVLIACSEMDAVDDVVVRLVSNPIW